ncbi:MAG: LytTR family DNA-binding domain-containing protein [Ginsengibacter sp.]|jgi:two-component system LytT family response regulator
MLTAIIIDDELKGRIALRQKLKDYCPDVQIVGEAESATEGISLVKTQKPDIVFLDIEMPRMDGFKMLQQLPDKHFHLIFTTAFNQYAIKAIKFAAFDYLLKPIDIEELKIAISRINKLRFSETEKKLEVLNQNMNDKNPFNKIAISTQNSLLLFEVSDIVYLEANRNYTTLHFKEHPKLITSKTLKDFEDLLPTRMFFRIHHSYMININYILRYLKGEGGQVELNDGTLLDVSRRKKEEFLKLIRM